MSTSTTAGTRLVWIAALFFGASLLATGAAGYLWGRATADRAPLERAKPAANDANDSRAAEEPVRHVHTPGDRPHEHPQAHEHPHDDAIHAAVATEPQGSEPQEPELSPEEGRAREVERLKLTGPDRRNLVVDARRVGDDWSKTAAEKKLGVSFGAWECYRGGCLVNALHAAAGSLESVTSEITHTRGFLDWNGEKLRTGPTETGDGKAEVTWILFAPPEGEQALRASNP